MSYYVNQSIQSQLEKKTDFLSCIPVQ